MKPVYNNTMYTTHYSTLTGNHWDTQQYEPLKPRPERKPKPFLDKQDYSFGAKSDHQLIIEINNTYEFI